MEKTSEFQVAFDFLGAKQVIVEPTAGHLTTDAGLLSFRQLDEQLGLTRRFADALTDLRAAVQVDHTFLEMARMRVYGILADYPDQNDHDRLRSDPLFKVLCNRSPHDSDLASQPTLPLLSPTGVPAHRFRAGGKGAVSALGPHDDQRGIDEPLQHGRRLPGDHPLNNPG